MTSGRKLWTWIAALTLFGLLGACGTKHETFRYRLTVEVETPDGPRIGSSVLEVALSETGDDAWVTPEASGVRAKLRGEVVAVDLPDDKVLFALLRTEEQGDAGAWWPFRIGSNPNFSGEFSGVRNARAMEASNAGGDLPRDSYPMLVTFGDLADPTSVERVDPNDLAASFGKGVRLKRITVQMTDDPVTTEVEKRLPWLERVGRERGALKPSGSIYLEDAEPINSVAPSDFHTELYKN